MLVVMALGGNTRLRLGEPNNADAQRRSLAAAARAIASVASEHAVVVTYANGLHAGAPAERLESRHAVSPPTSRDPLEAQGEGMIGNPLEEALGTEMPGRKIASVGTEVMVRLVPVGPHYVDTPDGRRFVAALGWMVVQDGNGFRRCIPSPEPQKIVQLNTITALIDAGAMVICVLGEGVTTTQPEFGLWEGPVKINADMAAALLAEQVGADLLMLLADVNVESVEVDWRRGIAPNLDESTVDALLRLTLAHGSVGPKVEAAYRFVESTGKRAAIGALTQTPDILRGDLGVQVKAYGIS